MLVDYTPIEDWIAVVIVNAGRYETPSRYPSSGGIVWCFVAGTPVYTEDGLVSIERLSADIKVFGRSEQTGAMEVGQVVATFRSFASEVVEIHLERDVIKCTREHPFWIVGRGWITASNLRRNDKLYNAEGRHIRITDVLIKQLSRPVAVYNLTVGQHNTYFVGKAQVLVHNKKP